MARDKTGKGIVRRHGKWWTRVPENLKRLARKDLRHVTGVYALYNGTMPVYIGKGRIYYQIRTHYHSDRKDRFWEHFSWYEIKGKEGLNKEIETLVLRLLPFYMRSLNRMGGKFPSGTKIVPADEVPIKDKWPKYGVSKRHPRKKSRGK